MADFTAAMLQTIFVMRSKIAEHIAEPVTHCIKFDSNDKLFQCCKIRGKVGYFLGTYSREQSSGIVPSDHVLIFVKCPAAAEYFTIAKTEFKETLESTLPTITLKSATPFGCWVCGETTNIQRCASCKMAQYCSMECQRTGWKSHKKDCAIVHNSRGE